MGQTFDQLGRDPLGQDSCCSGPQLTSRQPGMKCCSQDPVQETTSQLYQLQPVRPEGKQCDDTEVCCGRPPSPAAASWESPGYVLQSFVTGFISTPAGQVPQISTDLSLEDRWETFLIRLGIRRQGGARLAPGLYCLGRPDQSSPVLVTANYRLSFDAVRRELAGLSAWLLILDARGINVWCAAGKQLFSSSEVVHRVNQSGLERIVQHRRLILPQLGATGVSAHQVKRDSGFEVVWGPVRAADLPSFLENGCTADASMRLVTFSLKERAELIPVEFGSFATTVLAVLAVWVLLSGIDPGIFSLSSVWGRGQMGLWAVLAGTAAGLIGLPLLLPWLPGRAFAGKSAQLGLLAGLLLLAALYGSVSLLEGLGLLLLTTTLSSYLGMHFTGSTPYTSPSGVEKEMKWALPMQAGGMLLAAGLWVAAPFCA